MRNDHTVDKLIFLMDPYTGQHSGVVHKIRNALYGEG